ncbi:MAG: DUF3465 domain-containing protein [Candidatus Eremiobacteraeota bacterium]|nr:DUF3465 domain-containing protein [Candidatus Eremiobacteraeota bacterium]MBV9055717.1 DUF3465 domain-containing protein [Candidatus Eremiobacteraeota bacterium]MBV9699197.1 DUF3465 domain-containing protein [Candidatus Eremiobacteraeota bacterium]
MRSKLTPPIAGLLWMTACAAAQTPDDAAVCQAYASARSHVEVVADGTVTRVLGVAAGRVSPHEGFLLRLRSGCHAIVRVEANTDFTGEFALAPGQSVTVKGEYEYYPRGGVVHWTHRDPRGRHEGGFIETGGRRYE